MNGETASLGVSMVAILAGLATLLYGEYAGFGFEVVAAGGVVVLVGVGILTAHVARLPEPEDADAGH